MIELKSNWSDKDFDEMGWHDARLYAISFPDEKFKLALRLDYILKWDRSSGEGVKFWVSPSELVFSDVSRFKVNIDFEDNMLLFIKEIKRYNPQPSPNGKVTLWDFFIELDNGVISFTSTGFEQNMLKQPVLSDTQDLNSGEWFIKEKKD